MKTKRTPLNKFSYSSSDIVFCYCLKKNQGVFGADKYKNEALSLHRNSLLCYIVFTSSKSITQWNQCWIKHWVKWKTVPKTQNTVCRFEDTGCQEANWLLKVFFITSCIHWFTHTHTVRALFSVFKQYKCMHTNACSMQSDGCREDWVQTKRSGIKLPTCGQPIPWWQGIAYLIWQIF